MRFEKERRIGKGTAIALKVVGMLLMVTISLSAITAAYNVALRMPDLYGYELNRIQFAKEARLDKKDDELGDFFSQYMLGKEEKLEFIAEYQGREQNIFHLREQLAMERLRRLVDLALYAFFGLFALTVLGYIFMFSYGKKEELRTAFKGSVIFFLIFSALSAAIMFIPSTRELAVNLIFSQPFLEEELLSKVFTFSFAKKLAIGVTAISTVILLVGGSLTWRWTRVRRMFADRI